jgi:hypothetical protein
MMKTASNSRSITSVENDAASGTRSVREKAYARMNSPIRAGSRLFPMKPIDTAAKRDWKCVPIATGSTSAFQRHARIQNTKVAANVARNSSTMSAAAMVCAISPRFSLRKVYQSSAMLMAMPSSPRQSRKSDSPDLGVFAGLDFI